MTVAEYLAAQRHRVDQALERLVPPEAADPARIHAAMRYSLFAGGKRVRPILCIAAAEAVGGDVPGVEVAAATLELVHTYSLIHDDLPALDNDDYRRGRLTCHKVFGEAMAILAGDALLTLAFEVLGQLNGVQADRRANLVAELARAAGTVGGMIGGQVKDLESEGMKPDAPLLDSIHRAKTGALLRASVRMGAIYAGAEDGVMDGISRYGGHVGLAFQIVDDLLDVEQSSETLGKTAGKDAAQKKLTFPAVYGLAESKRLAEEERRNAHKVLESLGSGARRLREIADFIVHRTK